MSSRNSYCLSLKIKPSCQTFVKCLGKYPEALHEFEDFLLRKGLCNPSIC